MQGFDIFWSAWPRSTRKGAKSACLAKWKKCYYETCSDQIVKHVEWMKTTDDWRKQSGAFIPAPLVYLNQQRWDGADIPEIAPAVDMVQSQRAAWAAEDAKASKPSPEIAAKLAALRGLRNR